LYLAVGLFIALSAAFALWATSRDLMRALASAEWPSVQGTIIVSEVRRKASGGRTWYPAIEYEYQVERRNHTGSRLRFIAFSASGTYAEDTVAAFRQGARVPVYYDPKQPAESVLQPGADAMAFLFAGTPLVLLVFAILVARLGRPRAA
jgi:hypothetical protein